MKLKRLKEIIEKRDLWREKVEQLKRMRQWVIDAENILNCSWVEIPEGMKGDQETLQKKLSKNAEVTLRFDQFLAELRHKYAIGEMSQAECKCLKEFLRVLTNLRPHLIQFYDLDVFPRTNNDMEGFIRQIKARYRRDPREKELECLSPAAWSQCSFLCLVGCKSREMEKFRTISAKDR
jgi:hypothetical protein